MTIHVVYSSSDSYAQCTGISILSLLDNNKDIDELCIYVLDTNISQENKKKIEIIGNTYKRLIKFIPAQEQFDQNVKKLKLSYLRGAYNTYARVMLNTWFNFLDKILLIDSDTLIIGPIRELWETNLQNNLLAAVPEIAVYSKGSTNEDPDIVNGCNYYYNMGIVLCNLKQWRNENIDAYIATMVEQYDKSFSIADQSILNYALNDRFVKLHLKYNYYTATHSVSYKTMRKTFSQKVIFSETEFSEARNEPTVIHFVGHPFERPWYIKSVSPYKRLYNKYREKSPWEKEPLLSTPRSKNAWFHVYDILTYTMLRFRFYRYAHWFRYIIGQRIKRALNQNR